MDFRGKNRRRVLKFTLAAIAIATGAGLVWLATADTPPLALQLSLGIVFTLSLVGFIWLFLDPDTREARQSDELLKLASQMLDCTKGGMTADAAQQICELLLPATPAMAVAITDREVIKGYAGYNAENNEQGRPIRTTATHQTLEDGKPRILHNTGDIGLPMSSARINAAIVQPLYIGNTIEGTLKFYYRNGSQISRTQESVSHGFAELLSTQMAASALEEQVKLTTSMELKALQAQINPHFLFNTINTIASLIRTDPAKARELLRDFAVFYRSTLEDSDDLIELEREMKQVERYVSFEIARFGEERLQLIVDIDEDMYAYLVPSFMVQPLVENAVKHAMAAEGKLTITVTGEIEDDYIVLRVTDDGVGMSADTLANMMNKESDTGLGIAVKNVRDRIRGYFGPESSMEVTSELGVGTVVTFRLSRAIAEGKEDAYLGNDNLQETAIPAIPQPVVE
ncbi:MAG: histidine kinase [Eggerthellaceae bacterium]|nr:histidine kinase [Eggerthellaceae bacterium]